MYKVIIAPEAKKELKKISKLYKQAIRIAINDICEDPYIGKPLKREFLKKYSYRIGVNRIIYKIDEKEKKVYVFSAGHRSLIYN